VSFYTKYRPQTIAELDLTVSRESLQSILKSGKFSHAYLFSGSKGTGKTSSARILAKVLNCERNKGQLGSQADRESGSGLSEPCNTCDSCRRITSGMSLACLEMDAASNRGIDDIRTLKERIGLMPAEGLFTVYIIDEVHMLTTEAFNALLKTLEEPPDHAVFVLCTTDPQKIPDTVISRCTRISFSKANNDEVIKSLKKVIENEKLSVEPAAVEAIASRVDGSFRDGIKLLEQLSQNQEKITKDLVDEATGFGDEYGVEKVTQGLLAKDISLILDEFRLKQEQGIDFGIFGKRLVERLRLIMLESIKNKQNTSELISLTQKISLAASQIKLSVIPALPLEIACAEWCIEEQLQITNAKSKITNDKVEMTNPLSHSLSEASDRIQITNAKCQITNDKVEMTNAKQVEVKTQVVTKIPEPLKQGMFQGSLEEICGKWAQILTEVKPLNHSLEALLRSAKPISYMDGWLTIEAYYKFHKEQLEQERYRSKLEEAMASVLDGNVRLSFTLSNKGNKSDNPKVENISGTVEDDALVRAAEEILGKG